MRIVELDVDCIVLLNVLSGFCTANLSVFGDRGRCPRSRIAFVRIELAGPYVSRLNLLRTWPGEYPVDRGLSELVVDCPD